jgi:hypothetical protein
MSRELSRRFSKQSAYRRALSPSARSGHRARVFNVAEALEPRRLLSWTAPAYSSLPGAPHTLFLDFDGTPAFTFNNGTTYTAHGPGPADTPIPAFSMDDTPQFLSASEKTVIHNIWSHVAEKYSPFNVNVTTVDPGNRTDGVTEQVIIGGSDNDWYNKPNGGVSAIGGFTNPAQSNSCFVWTADLGWGFDSAIASSTYFAGETCAHEAGHSFGLVHERDQTGPSITEYYDGSGEISPIMGNSGNNQSRRGIWWQTNMDGIQNSPDPIQNEVSDLFGVLGASSDPQLPASSANTDFIDDGLGNLTASGIINYQLDADGFRFTAGGAEASFTISNAPYGAMLNPRAELMTYPGNVVVPTSFSIASGEKSITYSTSNLTAGQQYALNVHGDFSYGCMGQYTVVGTVQSIATRDAGIIHIRGFDNVADHITLQYQQNGVYRYVYVTDAINGDAQQTATALVPLYPNDSLDIATYGGADSVIFLGPIENHPASIDMGNGINNLELDGVAAQNNSFSIAANSVNFDGEPVSFNDSVIALTCRGNVGSDTFNLTGQGYANIAMYGGDGNDTASFSSGFIDAGDNNVVTFLGENGADTMIVGDASESVPITFTTDNNAPFSNGPAVSTSINGATRIMPYQTVETIRLAGGSDGDAFNIKTVPFGVTVRAEGNSGNDRVYAGNATVPFSQGIRGVLNMFGGAGDDLLDVDDSNWTSVGTYALTLSSVSNTFVGNSATVDIPVETVEFHARGGGSTTYTSPTFTSPGVGRNFRLFDGAGGGVGTLTINDAPVISQMVGLDLYSDRIVHNYDSNGAYSFSIAYAGFESLNITAANIVHSINIYGTSPDIPAGHQTTLGLGSGDDTVTVHPRDGSGNLTILSDIGVSGGGGTDTAIIDDTSSALPMDYAFGYAFSTSQFSFSGSRIFGAGSDVESVAVHAGSGDDTFTLAGASGAPLSPWLTLDGGGGNDSFILNDQVETHSIIYRLTGVTPAFQRVNNATSFAYSLNIPNIEHVRINAGTQSDELDAIATAHVPGVAFNPGGGSDTINASSNATLTLESIAPGTGNAPAVNVPSGSSVSFGSTMHLRSLALGGNATINPGGDTVIVIDALSISTGSLDVRDNDLILPGGVLGTWSGGSYSGITQLIAAGKIHSFSQTQQTRLGTATASQIKGISGVQTAIFDGQTVSPTDVVVKYTYAGDANLDGKVNIDDYGRIDANVGQSGTVFGWYNGDFNFDGKINIDDYGLIDSVIGAQGPVL